MLLKFFFNYLPLGALVLGAYSASFATGVDYEAFNREQNKVLTPFFLTPYVNTHIGSNNHDPYARGRKHVELYNQELAANPSPAPTPSMYHHLQQAIFALHEAIDLGDRRGELDLPGLKQARNLLVRWHLSHKYVSENVSLQEIAYNYDFVDNVLSKVSSLNCLHNANRYDGSLTNTDLAKYLKKLGFIGIWQGPYEHNWVRKDNMMVRVKRKPVPGIPGQYITQFTIGITNENPLVWNANVPLTLATDANGNPIAFDEDNEVLKLAREGRAVFIAPSRNFQERWHLFGFCYYVMRNAHFSLPGGFGDAGNHYNTQQVENLLSF